MDADAQQPLTDGPASVVGHRDDEGDGRAPGGVYVVIYAGLQAKTAHWLVALNCAVGASFPTEAGITGSTS